VHSKCARNSCCDYLKQELADRRTVSPVILLARGTRFETVVFDPRLLRSEGSKDRLFALVRRRAIASGADATLIAVDRYCFIPNMVRMRASDPMRVRRLAMEGIDALVAAGLGDKREALAVILQTPIYTLLLEQLYEFREQAVVFSRVQKN